VAADEIMALHEEYQSFYRVLEHLSVLEPEEASAPHSAVPRGAVEVNVHRRKPVLSAV
jgi:hypothetical protein